VLQALEWLTDYLGLVLSISLSHYSSIHIAESTLDLSDDTICRIVLVMLRLKNHLSVDYVSLGDSLVYI
jgi:hypothetical protein